MANQTKKFKGRVYFTKTKEPELSPFTEKGKPDKYSWKTVLRPNKDEIMNLMDLQGMGVKNKIKKMTFKEDGQEDYSIQFSRPTEIHSKTKGVIKVDPPKVFYNGEPFDGDFGWGSEAEVEVELYQHATPNGGKAHAARLYAIHLTKLVEYEPKESAAEF
jgi:hypothetical protein